MLCAVVAAGGTGELYLLTPDQHCKLAEVGGWRGVIVGVGSGRVFSVELARQSQQAEADGILMFPSLLPQRRLRSVGSRSFRMSCVGPYGTSFGSDTMLAIGRPSG